MRIELAIPIVKPRMFISEIAFFFDIFLHAIDMKCLNIMVDFLFCQIHAPAYAPKDVGVTGIAGVTEQLKRKLHFIYT